VCTDSCELGLDCVWGPHAAEDAGWTCRKKPTFRWNVLSSSSAPKSGPVTRHGGASGERRYSVYPFLTSTPEGGERSASRSGHALPPVAIVQGAGWTPEPVWTQRLEEKSSASVGDRTPAVSSVVRHCTDWATRLPSSAPNQSFSPC
jgi:hypothetical protein